MKQMIKFTGKGIGEFNVEFGGENVGTLTTIADKYYLLIDSDAATDYWSINELRQIADKLEELNNEQS